eukprot:CAMPEP_0174283016 /NCGR_PEP_ID=MMETSP0809-20121228/3614_1 /TAXON_ID=73025 ORGANISM="Eutreptiella gymnastica-like, Strain CCMP1594" /NCGR_SAMPLE_ID=MMETSP0809 /ASSEMBLY_ACC=CAM_ASM_000658 /LENGTH=70 /DNA_ID=CAMNT_0015377617 /DNA_START=319 /DNA_END=528 /DNA_ORIENTATION=-
MNSDIITSNGGTKLYSKLIIGRNRLVMLLSSITVLGNVTPSGNNEPYGQGLPAAYHAGAHDSVIANPRKK